MSVLHIENLTAGYGKRRILENVSLRADAGEIAAILGENGSGKTTLLRAVQGIIPLQSGTVTVNGTDLSRLNTKKRAALVTMMPQDHPAIAGLTGMDLIETAFYPSRGLFGNPTAADREKIRTSAESFGIPHLLGRDLSEMSAGERQMISLLRAAVQDTPVLLLDEPSSALDFNHTGALFALLKRLAAHGKTILIVLHDPTLALRHASKIVRMGHGTAEDVLDNRSPDYEKTEASLRMLYPALRVNRDPLFCYTETSSCKETNYADH